MTIATNTERNREIVRLRAEGEASLGDIAERFNISRERVRQISLRAGIDNKAAAEAYAERRNDIKTEQAMAQASVILMRWIGCEDIPDIAKSLGLTVGAAQAVLDEQVTDEIVAARSNNRMAKRFPGSDAGPRNIDGPAREDRHWTTDRCMNTLLWLAQQQGGRLPSSTKYMEISKGRDDLPSFATVRNRCGRWSSVRAEIHRRISNGRG